MGNKKDQENITREVINVFGNNINVENLNGMKKVNLKAKVLSYKGITYIDRSAVGIIAKSNSRIDIDRVINLTRYQLLNLYLKPVKVFHISDEEWNDLIIDKNNANYRNSFNGIDMNTTVPYVNKVTKEIVTTNDDVVIWKIISSKGSIFILVYNTGYEIVIFDHETNVCTINVIPLDEAFSLLLNYGSIGPLYIAKKDRYINNVINDTRAIYGHTIDGYYLNIIHYALKLYKSSGLALKERSHSPFEIKIFMKMFKYAFAINEFNYNIFIKINAKKINEVTDSSKIPLFVYDRSLNFPVVDFSKREWNFITKYMESKLVDNENDSLFINISNALKETRYGNTLKIAFRDDKLGLDFDCITSIEYLEETDQCTFYIVYFINDDISIYSTIVYSNMKHFNPSENLVSINTDICLNYLNDSISSIPSNIEEIESNSPSIFFDTDEMMNIIASLISVHVVIFDRPERSRMIKEVRKNISHNTDTRNKNKKVSNNSNVITTHILLPVNDAKKYLKEAAESNGEVYREYVVESWKRKGYYRRKPGSDEKIFIKPTTCKRHMELTKKEIHVKL